MIQIFIWFMTIATMLAWSRKYIKTQASKTPTFTDDDLEKEFEDTLILEAPATPNIASSQSLK